MDFSTIAASRSKRHVSILSCVCLNSTPLLSGAAFWIDVDVQGSVGDVSSSLLTFVLYSSRPPPSNLRTQSAHTHTHPRHHLCSQSTHTLAVSSQFLICPLTHTFFAFLRYFGHFASLRLSLQRVSDQKQIPVSVWLSLPCSRFYLQ